MKKKILWITYTAIFLALLVTLQAVTKSFGQLVTGSCVNAVLALCVLLTGLPGGITVALISPVAAFLLGIAPQVLTVPAIMAGNAVYVVILHIVAGKGKLLWRQILAVIAGACAKFAVLYAAVSWLICGLLADALLASGMLKQPMLKALPASFGVMQLFTALIGGGVALAVLPLLRKAIKK